MLFRYVEKSVVASVWHRVLTIHDVHDAFFTRPLIPPARFTNRHPGTSLSCKLMHNIHVIWIHARFHTDSKRTCVIERTFKATTKLSGCILAFRPNWPVCYPHCLVRHYPDQVHSIHLWCVCHADRNASGCISI